MLETKLDLTWHRIRVRFDNPHSLRIKTSVHPLHKVSLLAFVVAVGTVQAQTTPTKLATSARLDLLADSEVRALASMEIARGTGTVEPMNWVSEAERPRAATAQFPINHLAWSECLLPFVPDRRRPMTLSLMSPW